MNVREALEKKLEGYAGHKGGHLCPSALAHFLSADYERALRAAVEKLQQIYDIPLDDVEAKKEVERCLTAGVAAMVEEL